MSNSVSLEEVVAEASTYIGEVTDAERNMMRQWVFRALNLIGPSRDNVKVCTIKPKDLSFTLPDDCIGSSYVIDIALYDSNGEVAFTYEDGVKRIHNLGGGIDISMDGKYINMSSEAKAVAYAKIRYFSLPVNVQGELMITEDAVFAIVCFIRYAWAMRKNDNRSQIDQDRTTWIGEMQRVKANRKMPSELEATHILKRWASLIPALNRKTYSKF